MPLPAGHYWFPWLPDYEAGVSDKPAALTTLAGSITGAEERAVWLPSARRTLRYRLAPPDVATGVRMTDQLRAARVTGRASIPHWGRARLLSAYAPGSAVITATLAHGLIPGSMAALFRPSDDQARLVQVAAVASAVQLTLTAPIPAGWAGDVWIVPVLNGRLQEPSWAPLGDLRRISVEFAEFPPAPAPAPNWLPFEVDSSHLWNVLPVADFFVIRYTWADGSDLDTRTAMIETGTAADGDDIGWSRGDSVVIGGEIVLEWGGDNTGNPGVEAVLVDFNALKAALPAAATFKLRLRAFWYGVPVSGNFILSITGYVGGVMNQVGTDFTNAGGVETGVYSAPRNAAIHVSSDIDGQDMAVITYRASSSQATIALA